MRTMRRTLLMVVLVLSACGPSATQAPGTTPATTTASGNGAGSDVVCKEETKTGSTIPREVCRSRVQSEDDRKGAQDMLEGPRSTPFPNQ
jgi:hypothetical protein